MVQRKRWGFTSSEKAELWDRWQRGESLSSIGRAFGKPSSSIHAHISPCGGIRPAVRHRSRLALTLCERETISRGIATHQSVRSMAQLVGRSPSTVSREINRNGGYDRYRAAQAENGPGSVAVVRSLASWRPIRGYDGSWRASSDRIGRRSRCAGRRLAEWSRSASGPIRETRDIRCLTRRSIAVCGTAAKNSPIIAALAWRRTSMSTFATPAVCGNAVPTRTPTVCSDSTSRREPRLCLESGGNLRMA